MSYLPTEILDLVEAGRLQRALVRVDAALDSHPSDIALLELKARILMADLQYDAALYVWRDVEVFGPPSARVHLEKARCLAEVSANAEAVESLQTALALKSSLRAEIEDDWRFDRIVDQI